MGIGLTGGHWRPCNIGSVEAHNERRPEYLESVKKAGLNLYFFEHLTKNNSHWVNDLDRYKDKTVADVFETMKKIYTEKTGQKPQLNEKTRVNKKTGKEYKIQGWAPIQEMCVPIKIDTKIEDFDYLKKWAKKYGIEIIRIDLHKDEGYHNEKTGEYKMNYHAHVVASFFDWETGRTVKPPSESMSEMQTILAIALGMGRGKRKEETGAKALTAMQYRLMKEREDLEKVEAEKTAAKEQLNNVEKNLKNMEIVNNTFDTSVLEEELLKVMQEKAETELDIHRIDLTIKKINAFTNMKKAKAELMKLQLEQQRLTLEERRLSLDEFQTKYNICSDLVRKSEKIQRVLGKTMIGLFPEQDKQVVKIMEAAKKLSTLKNK